MVMALSNESGSEAYVRAALENGRAAEDADHRRANRWFDRLSKARRQLRLEPDRGRAALLKMLKDDSPWVRMYAATDLLGTDQTDAVETLENIMNDATLRGRGFIRVDAEMVLREWRAGRLEIP